MSEFYPLVGGGGVGSPWQDRKEYTEKSISFHESKNWKTEKHLMQ